MSRSALERIAARKLQHGVVEVDHSAIFDEADQLAEGREVKSNELPMHGNTTTYNLNPMLCQTIVSSDYFKSLYETNSFLEVVDEIYERCSHVAPWAAGTSRIPSSAFCLLMKLFVMRVTRKQMIALLEHKDSPYIRAVGLLYLRYTCPPKELWAWYEPYLDDAEEIKPSPEAPTMTVGEYIVKLIKEMQYYGTMLPRIPVPIERKMKVHLLLHQEKKKRAAANQAIKDRLRAGVKVRAIYADEENDPAWYEAVIDAVERADDEGVPDSYWVTFPEYGNASLVGLGEIQLLESKDESRSRSRDPHRDRERAERRERRDEADRDKERGGGGGGGGEKRRRDDSKERGGGAGARHRGRRDDSRERERRRRGSHSRSDSRSRGGGGSSGGGARKHARRGSRSRSRSRGRHEGRGGGGAGGGGGGGGGDAGGFTGSILDNPDALYAQVVENDRKASTAVGKDYASRPTSYKGSLSLKADRFTVRRKSSSRSPDRARAAAAAGGAARGRSRSPPPRAEPRREPAKITAESLRKAEDLKRKYGDASAKM